MKPYHGYNYSTPRVSARLLALCIRYFQCQTMAELKELDYYQTYLLLICKNYGRETLETRPSWKLLACFLVFPAPSVHVSTDINRDLCSKALFRKHITSICICLPLTKKVKMIKINKSALMELKVTINNAMSFVAPCGTLTIDIWWDPFVSILFSSSYLASPLVG